MAKRSPEQVHEEDGHPTPVASCSLCHPEPAAAEPPLELVGEHGPEPAELATGGVVTGPSMLLDEPAPYVVRPGERGQCVEDGCTNNATHRDGRCCDCHRKPRPGEAES